MTAAYTARAWRRAVKTQARIDRLARAHSKLPVTHNALLKCGAGSQEFLRRWAFFQSPGYRFSDSDKLLHFLLVLLHFA